MGLLDFFGQIGSSIIGAGSAKWQQASEQEFNAAEAEKARQFNAEEAEKSRDWQTQEREATQDWNLEQWNRENEYNSPEQQMARAMAAGINPNVAAQAIGGGSAAAGSVRSSAGSGAQASGPAASAPGSIAGSIADLVGNTVNNFWDNAVKRAEATGKDIENQYAPQLNEAELRKADAEVGNILANTRLTDAERKQVYQAMRVVAQKTPYEIKSMIAGINEAIAQTGLIKEQTETQEAQQEVLDAQESQIRQQTENLRKEGQILDEEKTIRGVIAGLAQQGIIAGYNEVQALYIAAKNGADIGAITAPYLMMQEANQQIATNAYGDQKQWDTWSNHSSPQPFWTRLPELVYRGVGSTIDGAFGFLNTGFQTGDLGKAFGAFGDRWQNGPANLSTMLNMPTDLSGGTIYGSPGKYYMVQNGRIFRIPDAMVAKIKRANEKKKK